MMTRNSFTALLALVAVVIFTPLQASPELRQLHHDLRVSLDPASGSLSVIDQVSLKGQGEVEFRLAPSIRLLSLKLDGSTHAIDPVESGQGVWRLDLGAGGGHRLELAYAGRFKAFADDKEPAAPQSPLIGRQASYLPPGSGWYPDFIHGGQALPFSYQIQVSVPAPHQAVVPGRLLEEAEQRGRYLATFAFPDSARGIALFAGPYQVSEHLEGRLRLRTYFYTGMEALSEEYLTYSAQYLKYFEQSIGPYPFSTFHMVAAPFPVGLGFAGITYMGERVLALPFIKHSSLGHEILHNWWGNGVYVDYASGNWAEGLTTYLADYAFLEQESEAKARSRRLAWLRDYAALPATRDRAARTFTSKTHVASQVVGYNKVAFVFHMLRLDLGQAVFDAAIRRFWRERRFQVTGWQALERVFSAEAGRDLSDIFAQWLDRTGAPQLSLRDVSKHREQSGEWLVSLTVQQAGNPYRLRLPLRVETDQGLETRFVMLEQAVTPLEIRLSNEPLALAADPDFDLFRSLLPEEAPPILRDALLSQKTQTVLLGDDPFQAQGLALAKAMLDSPVEQPVSLKQNQPFLLIAPSAEVGAFLHSHQLAAVPEEVAGQGSSRVWAARTSQGIPYVVVGADDLPALAALARPLPHYGRLGYLVFQGTKAVVQENWPLQSSGIVYRFGEN